MCSEQSELSKQVIRVGGEAQRFGKAQGDLKTPDGRCRLFNAMVSQKPRHLWYSPECGPWWQWSDMNMGKSIASCQAILPKDEINSGKLHWALCCFAINRRSMLTLTWNSLEGQPCGRRLECLRSEKVLVGMNSTCVA